MSESKLRDQKTRCLGIGFSTKCSAPAEREASFGREVRFARDAHRLDQYVERKQLKLTN